MKELFNKTTTSIILSSIVSFIIGLIMVVAPDLSLQTIGVIVGIYVILHGIVLMSLAFALNVIYVPFFGVMSGLLSIILGIVLVAMPNVLTTVFAIALGIWIILSSINIISIAITIRKQYSNWVLLLILGIVDLVAGFIVLFNPFAASMSVVFLGGIIVMIHSAVCIVDMIMIKRDVKEITKAIEASFKELKQSNSK